MNNTNNLDRIDQMINKVLEGTDSRTIVSDEKTEAKEIDLGSEIQREFTALYNKLQKFRKGTSDKNWDKAIMSLLNDLDRWDDKMGGYNSKLGVIPQD